MKTLFLVLAFFLIGTYGSAQTWEEWTQQKKTRIRRLLEQIAANKVYIGYAQKGYTIIRDGLHSIQDIKGGDFRLHLGHFDSLKLVNPRVKNWVKVAEIMAAQLRILKSCKQAITTVGESGQFTPDELDYCKQVFDRLLEECLKNIDELVLVITDGKLAMTDAERIKQIEKLYVDMQEKSAFTASFTGDMRVLARQRLTEQTELQYSKTINGF